MAKKTLKKYQTTGNVKIKKTVKKTIDPGFYMTPESVGGTSKKIDRKFYVKPEKVGGTSKNIDKGFNKNPLKKKK